ncbi:leucine-rich repeat domain-containing protein [Hahella sp. KA22]|uniref:leucine-rich repeat domain-containing protein n=1 Tax=Hahella sp. KA22 TaxID=1628392 RepID=UPI000FDCFD01|nr:leucine-rich repeat domain-containing protein [Hahella sp. KA22]AZZ92379.1 leucine-rich repeat domain-containing protein [Hahella sp. KA22]QAY55753.1 leucine-rich repeat domain-containing protein [Hahella sp. KA22]
MLKRALTLTILILLAGCGQSDPQKIGPSTAPQYSQVQLRELSKLCDADEPSEASVASCITLNRLKKSIILDLEGMNIRSLPEDAFMEMEHVRILRLGNNSLSELPKSIAMLKKLRQIYIDDNNFSEFPAVLLSLTSIKDIFASNNRIGFMPKEIERLKSLRRIIVSLNDFREFPVQLKNNEELRILDLSMNKISVLPEEIGSFDALVGLSLSGNKLREIPREIGMMTKLTMLDLSANELKELPVEIAALPELKRSVEGHHGFVRAFVSLSFNEDVEEIYGSYAAEEHDIYDKPEKFSGINILFNNVENLDSEFCNVFFIKKDSNVYLNCN